MVRILLPWLGMAKSQESRQSLTNQEIKQLDEMIHFMVGHRMKYLDVQVVTCYVLPGVTPEACTRLMQRIVQQVPDAECEADSASGPYLIQNTPALADFIRQGGFAALNQEKRYSKSSVTHRANPASGQARAVNLITLLVMMLILLLGLLMAA